MRTPILHRQGPSRRGQPSTGDGKAGTRDSRERPAFAPAGWLQSMRTLTRARTHRVRLPGGHWRMTMAWHNLAHDILEDLGACSVTEHQRGAYDRWRARRTAAHYESRRALRELHNLQIRAMRARERRRVSNTAFAIMLAPKSVAEALAAPAMTGTGGRKPHRYGQAR